MKSREQFESIFLKLRPDDKQLIEMHNHGTADNPEIDYFSLAIRDACGWFELGRQHAIKQQNQQQYIPEIISQGWIKCSDHKPERGTDVQVYCSDTREQFVTFHLGNGVFQFAHHEGTPIACRPSHWMPLPAAPEKPL